MLAALSNMESKGQSLIIRREDNIRQAIFVPAGDILSERWIGFVYPM